MGLKCCQSVHNVAKLKIGQFGNEFLAKLTNSTKLVQNVSTRQLQIKPLYILPLQDKDLSRLLLLFTRNFSMDIISFKYQKQLHSLCLQIYSFIGNHDK